MIDDQTLQQGRPPVGRRASIFHARSRAPDCLPPPQPAARPLRTDCARQAPSATAAAVDMGVCGISAVDGGSSVSKAIGAVAWASIIRALPARRRKRHRRRCSRLHAPSRRLPTTAAPARRRHCVERIEPTVGGLRMRTARAKLKSAATEEIARQPHGRREFVAGGLKQLVSSWSDRHGFVIASDECYSEIYFDEANLPLGARWKPPTNRAVASSGW